MRVMAIPAKISVGVRFGIDPGNMPGTVGILGMASRTNIVCLGFLGPDARRDNQVLVRRHMARGAM